VFSVDAIALFSNDFSLRQVLALEIARREGLNYSVQIPCPVGKRYMVSDCG
jgi:hypothetical protein